MFFHWVRNKPKLVADNAGHSFLRIILMLMLFTGLVWAFWMNSERYVYKLSADARLVDNLDAFNQEQRKEIAGVINRFYKKFKIKLHVETRGALFSSADAEAGDIVLGLCPSMRQVVLFMPAMWRAGVGDGFILQLKEGMLEPAFDTGAWPAEVPKALILLEQRFDALMR